MAKNTNTIKCCRLLKLLTAFICVYLFDVAYLSAQEIIEPEYFSVSEGLASPVVNDVIQDSYGILWIATANGLQKYDGYKFYTFKNVPGVSSSLQNNFVWGMLEDSNHDIWVGTNLGVSKYIREKNEFENYNFATIFNYTANSEVSGFRFLIDSRQRLWATSIAAELLLYDPAEDTWNYADYDIPNETNPIHSGFVPDIIEDDKGGLWMGSNSYGLMYLAKDDSAFSPVLPGSLNNLFSSEQNNTITNLFLDESNTLWITSRNGIYKYIPDSGEFMTIREYFDESPEDVWNNWNSIKQDPQGNIWIANNFHGILKFDGISDNYKEVHVAGIVKTKTRGWNLSLTNLMIDKSGIFWIGSRELGLLKYDPINKPFSFYAYDEDNPKSMSPNGVYGLLASRVNPGRIYVGTRGDGLNVFDAKNKVFKKVRFKAENDMFGGSVRSIGETNDGTLYIGTWGDGLIRLNDQFKEVRRFIYEPDNPNSISDNKVRVIKPYGRDYIWIGTNNGLNIFDREKKTFQRVLSRYSRTYPDLLTDELNRMIDSGQVSALINNVADFADFSKKVEIKTAGTYFVASVGEGFVAGGMADFGWIENEAQDTLWAFTEVNKSYYAGGGEKNRMTIEPITLQPGTYTLRYVSDDSHSYGKWNVAEPTELMLYGIALIKPADEKQEQHWQSLIKMKRDEMAILGNNIIDIEFSKSQVWVSAGGLNKINLTDSTVTLFEHDPENSNSPASNNILDIFKDRMGLIWLATDAGLDRLDPETGQFTHFTEEDGLPTNLTQAILEGDNNDLWIATENGISHMITNSVLGKATFINYNSSDGLGGDSFLYGAADRIPDGRFWFGGEHGLTTFSKVVSNNTPPLLIFTNMLVSNRSVLNMGDESPLEKSLQETENIELSYTQNNLSFEFAALHYANPQKNQYAHILKGYDDDWVYDNRNYASYTNLNPGEYEFIIRASNAFGIWNEDGKSLRIIINRPWWSTWWAFIIYAILFLSFLYVFNRWMRNRLIQRERERAREKELEQAREIERAYTELKATQSQLIQSEKMASLGELTAGIAHEIQNPLNFVNNFSDVNQELITELIEEIGKGNFDEVNAIANDIEENEQKINHHGKRAEAIVKGMLQHSRGSSSQKEPTDLNALCDEYLRLSYHGLRARDKSFNADFKLEADESLPKIKVIPQDIGRVLLNLINNAFYAVYSKTSTKDNNYKPLVVVSTSYSPLQGGKGGVEIRVKDNGPGIPEEIKKKIFQPFFTTKPAGQGTGLGLSMSYDIVTKGHGGTISVESLKNEGTEFIIQLPIK